MKFTSKILIALVAIALCASSVMAISPNALEGRKVLYVYGGWYGHDPEPFRDFMVPWLESEGAIVTVSNTTAIYEDRELMESVELIIQHITMSNISGGQLRNLLGAVRRGAGIAGWHGGIGDSFRNDVGFQFMVGGQWVAHPGNLIDYMVNVTEPNHPIMQGIDDFMVYRTEQYYMHVSPNSRVLATTQFSGDHAWWIEGSTMPVVWVRQYGHGRVFYSSLGHVIADIENENVLEIKKRGIRWAAESMDYVRQGRVTQWVRPVY